MKAVIGQEKLVKTLESYTLESVPKTMIFLGPSGCGKTWIANAFAKQLELETIQLDIGDTTKYDMEELKDKLIDFYQCPIRKLYLFNLKGASEIRQTALLKLIEEPSMYMNIILMAESEVGILPTIINRCVKHTFEPYTPEQLKQFDWAVNCNEEIAYEICKTPGQLLELSANNLNQVFELCDTILNSIKFASYSNTLSLVTKINVKDDAKKIDFKLFFDIMTYSAFNHYKTNNDDLSFNIYLYTIRQQAKALNINVAKEAFLLNYLDGIWRLAH